MLSNPELSAASAAPDPAQVRRLDLPARLDSNAAEELASILQGLRHRPLVLDARAVDQAGALCLQLLVSAQRQWQADGETLSIESPSTRLTGTLGLLGLSDHLNVTETGE
ncbi:MAG: STAS domain-containing protein [Rhodobacteraceae bacterium]|nr:STAS domain-containing protein [Paracoccaceae bacterium]